MKRVTLAVVAGLLIALAFGSAASAAVVIKDTGTHGDWGTNGDDQTTPGGKCGYSAADNTGTAHLRWIKVFPVFAGTSPGVSQQPIKWTVTIQRSPDNGSTWKVVGSLSQTRTASGGNSAAYDALKVSLTSKPSNVYRAVSTLQWIRNGSVTGLVKFRMEYYSVKWTVGQPDFVFQTYCTGAAD